MTGETGDRSQERTDDREDRFLVPVSGLPSRVLSAEPRTILTSNLELRTVLKSITSTQVRARKIPLSE
jgi:hypothetical protein